MPGTTDLVARTIDLLRYLAENGSCRYGDLRRQLAVPAPTLTRLLRALAASDLVIAGPDETGYRLGPGANALALDLLGRGCLARQAQPAVDALARQTGDSAALFMWERDRAVLIAKCEVPDGHTYIPRYAHRRPWENAFTRMLVAGRPAEERGPLLDRLATALDAATRSLLRRSVLQAVRQQGFDGIEPVSLWWRSVRPVRIAGRPIAVIGVTRHDQPTTAHAALVRRCVADAAKRLTVELHDRES